MFDFISTLAESLDEEQAEMTATLVHTIRPDWPEADIYKAIERDMDVLSGPQLLAQLFETAGDPDQLWPSIWPAPKDAFGGEA